MRRPTQGFLWSQKTGNAGQTAYIPGVTNPASHRIRPELADLAIPIDSVSPHPRNARRGDVGAVAASLEEHGQYAPIIVSKRGMRIVAGSHRWRAAKQLGWDEIAAQVLDLTDVQAKKLLLVDNRTSDLATYDHDALLELLGSLPSMEGTGFTLDAVDDLMAHVAEFDQPLALSLSVSVTLEDHDALAVWESFRAEDPKTFPNRLIARLRG